MKRILFVCTGNICRSPTAEAVAWHVIEASGLSEAIEVDSAGISDYHTGEAPDPRACRAGARRGYDLAPLRARRLETEDFERFDLLVAMDRSHLEAMRRRCPEVHRSKLVLFMSFARRYVAEEVPDPYFGGEAGFDAVLDMCEDAVGGLLEEIAPAR
jgi:protein-tyrosine phosphatase